MCSGSEAGSYLRLMDFVYHSTLGLRVIRKKRRNGNELPRVTYELPRVVYAPKLMDWYSIPRMST